MNRASHHKRDYAFGQKMLDLRSAIGLTQSGLAEYLGVSRRAVGEWEAGNSYPKLDNFKQLIGLAAAHGALPVDREAEEIRTLWVLSKQKTLLDDVWLANVLSQRPRRGETDIVTGGVAASPSPTPLVRPSPTHHQLPFQPTSFIGRQSELEEITAALNNPACRLLTLLGPGGIGKTRLSLQAASQAAATSPIFSDGVAFVGLASISAASQIMSTVADALHLALDANSNPTTIVYNVLRAKHLLLVLDNFEHVLDGAILITPLLEHAPNVKILVTSRERLNLPSEWLFDVSGLAFPREDSTPSTLPLNDAAQRYSAVQLFVQRATQVHFSAPRGEDDLASIIRICQAVAGMPLAIELAAAMTRMLSLQQIERQLQSSIDVLATTHRDVPERHRSLRAAFGESWELLSPQDQALFSRLAVFRGGWTVDAAMHVAGATLNALLGLVDKSLVTHVNDDATTSQRFIMLEPLREYALERLAERGELNDLHYAHAVYFLEQAEMLSSQWDSDTLDAALGQLHRERDNLSVVFQWSLDSGNRLIGLELVSTLARFWRNRGWWSEGRAWIAQLLAAEDELADTEIMRARLNATRWAAWLAADQHDFAQAGQLLEQSSAIRQQLNLPENETDITLLLVGGLQARTLGNYPRAMALLEDSLARHRRAGNRESAGNIGFGLSLQMFGSVAREHGDFARAHALYTECLEFHRELSDREAMVAAQLGLADIARDQGDAALARHYSEQALGTAHDLGMQWAIGFALNNLAMAAYLDGDIAQASAYSDESLALFRNLQADSSIAEILITHGWILRARGDTALAYAEMIDALRRARPVGPRLLIAQIIEALATLTADNGDTVESLQLLAAASTLRAQMGAPARPIDQAINNRTLSRLHASLGDLFGQIWQTASAYPIEDLLDRLTS